MSTINIAPRICPTEETTQSRASREANREPSTALPRLQVVHVGVVALVGVLAIVALLRTRMPQLGDVALRHREQNRTVVAEKRRPVPTVLGFG